MKPLWTIQFKIDDATWESLSQEALALNRTPLSIALERGLFNENHLLAWERENSGVSSLKSIFFNGEPPTELWARCDLQVCLKNFCMPIATWDDKVYWAKLSSEPVELESTLTQVVWVLAPWSGLKKWFQIWQNSHASQGAAADKPAAEPLEVPEMPSNLNLTPDVPAASFSGFNIKLGADDVTSGDKPINMRLETNTSTIGGFPAGVEEKRDSGLSRVDFGSIKLATQTQAPVPEMPAPLAPQAPQHQPQPQSQSQSPPPPQFQFQPQPATTPYMASQATSPSISAVTGTQIDFGTHSMVMPAPTAPTRPAPTFETATPIQPVIPNIRPSFSTGAPTMPLMNSAPANMPPMPPMSHSSVTENIPPTPVAAQEIVAIPLETLSDRLKGAKSQEELASVLMGGWQNYFEKVMILLVQDTGLIVWRWSGYWFGNFQRGQTIPLDTPSIFKIAHDTAHPYHGYVSPGPVNDHFFSVTNGNQYPEHVTIVPVLTEGNVVAMLFGACAKNLGQQIVLNRLEDQTKLFGSGLLRFVTIVPKAG